MKLSVEGIYVLLPINVTHEFPSIPIGITNRQSTQFAEKVLIIVVVIVLVRWTNFFFVSSLLFPHSEFVDVKFGHLHEFPIVVQVLSI